MPTSFRLRLAGVAALGLAVRVWAVDTYYRQLPLGFTDNFFYSIQSKALAAGDGFANPYLYDATGAFEPSADHPPLYSLYLALWSLLGFDTAGWHRLASCLLGVATILVVAMVARRIAGDRAGLVAGVAAALFPPLWIVDGTIVAESLFAPIMAGVILAGLRFAEQPDNRRAAVLGVVLALGALTRSEGAALTVLCALPLVLVVRPLSWGARFRLLTVTAVAFVLVITPWTVRNLRSFEEPVTLAYGAGYVLKIGSCDETYGGRFLGYWKIDCAYQGDTGADPSVGEKRARAEALDYIGDNLERVPAVVAARVGRLWHLYRPIQGTDFDVFFERRGRFPTDAGLWTFYALVPLAAAGAWSQRRRPEVLVLTGSLVVSATLSAAIAFGITRYRIAGDVVIVILAGVGVDALLRRYHGR
ncbi:MAG: ArnT family glycosyltransferase [Acidimicrobiales bacterium]